MLKFADPVLCNFVRYALTTAVSFLGVIVVNDRLGLSAALVATILAIGVHTELTKDLFK
jgi:hypothetical protein